MAPAVSGSMLGPYQVTALLGAGGMGEVYLARDPKLGRDVALKVLPDSLAKDPEALARFEREARAVAALSHPNIRGIHDLQSAGGVVFAVMELLQGEDLRGRISAGPLREKQALDIALQVARGLAAAHEKGIVHRDLKPENLFITKDGFVKILDFGLAKEDAHADAADGSRATTAPELTAPGSTAGTPSYMSPEQVKGIAVDHRSDIFSFGSVLYEMLTGRKAFQRNTSAEAMAAILRDEPPSMSSPHAPISPALERVVAHCLQKSPDDRFQSAKDVVFALQEVASGGFSSPRETPRAPTRLRLYAAVAAVLSILVAAAALLLRRSPTAPAKESPAAPRRIAVLPFENLGSREDDYFADGVTDEVRGKLTSLAGLEVIARGSSIPYKRTTKTPKQIAQELETSFFLTGTIRREKSGTSERVHVSPELVEVRKDGPPASRWQQRFEAELTDVFQVQSDIASRVAEALGVAMGAGEEKRLVEKPTRDVSAYDAFLRGQEQSALRFDPTSLRRAIGHYERAVALDPSFAQAWAQLSRTRSLLYGIAPPTPELAEQAGQAAERALTLAPGRPDGYLAMGVFYQSVPHDSLRALEELEKARRLAPADASVLAEMCGVERSLGRWEASLQHSRQAASLDPRSIASVQPLGNALLYLRRHSEALQATDRALALAPANLVLLEQKALITLALGDLAGAQAVLRAAPKELDPTDLVAHVAIFGDLGWILDREQQELLLRLTPASFGDDRAVRAICFAQVYAWRGDARRAREHAEEAAGVLEEQLRAATLLQDRRVYVGLALAYAGRKADAIREGERGVALLPISKDADLGPYLQHQLVRIYILTGENEKALDALEPLLKVPYLLTPKWLAIDPNFAPLRGNPRFERMMKGG